MNNKQCEHEVATTVSNNNNGEHELLENEFETIHAPVFRKISTHILVLEIFSFLANKGMTDCENEK